MRSASSGTAVELAANWSALEQVAAVASNSQTTLPAFPDVSPEEAGSAVELQTVLPCYCHCCCCYSSEDLPLRTNTASILRRVDETW